MPVQCQAGTRSTSKLAGGAAGKGGAGGERGLIRTLRLLCPLRLQCSLKLARLVWAQPQVEEGAATGSGRGGLHGHQRDERRAKGADCSHRQLPAEINVVGIVQLELQGPRERENSG